jgi:hypothetical protein
MELARHLSLLVNMDAGSIPAALGESGLQPRSFPAWNRWRPKLATATPENVATQ